MGLFSGQVTSDVIAILIGIMVAIIAFYKWSFTYWKRKGLAVPYQPIIPFGNISGMFMGKYFFGEQLKVLYDKTKAEGLKHAGIYFMAQPIYMVLDPELIKHVMQIDFQHFVNHGSYINEKDDPLSDHLFAQEDDKWKQWRVKLTPTFTTGKMKMMFQTMVETIPYLVEKLEDHSANKTAFEIKDLFARFTTDIIGSCAFGIKCNSLKNPDGEFRHYGRLAIEDVSVSHYIKNFMQFILPHGLLRFYGVKTVEKKVEEFFMNAVKETVEYREKNNVYRKDFMHLMLQLKNRGKVVDDEKVKENGVSNEYVTMPEVAAQCFVFFVAGFETSSTASTFALYEMAKNQKVQQKLRDEINRVLEKHNGKTTYDAMMEMTYLEKVIQESLRMYPPVSVLTRVCNKEYKVPDSDVIIDKGTRVMIPIFGLQRDPEYYPNPDVFDPDRFNEENKNKRHPFTWLPFGEGPRLCIGLRFGMMQAKIGIASIIRNYKISLNKKTKQPITLKRTGFITSPSGGIWLDAEKVNY